MTVSTNADPKPLRHLVLRQAKMQAEHAQAGSHVLIKLLLFGQIGWIVAPARITACLRHWWLLRDQGPAWLPAALSLPPRRARSILTGS